MNPEQNLTWSDVEKAVDIIVNRIGDKKYDFVIGIANGGLIPATLIAKKLNLKTLSVGMSSYKDKAQLDKVTVWSDINKISNMFDDYGTCLIVDDICDSGKTFHCLKSYYLTEAEITADTASLAVKPKSTFTPDYYSIIIDSDTWIKFPWE